MNASQWLTPPLSRFSIPTLIASGPWWFRMIEACGSPCTADACGNVLWWCDNGRRCCSHTLLAITPSKAISRIVPQMQSRSAVCSDLMSNAKQNGLPQSPYHGGCAEQLSSTISRLVVLLPRSQKIWFRPRIKCLNLLILLLCRQISSIFLLACCEINWSAFIPDMFFLRDQCFS